jgi:hypothetical protein
LPGNWHGGFGPGAAGKGPTRAPRQRPTGAAAVILGVMGLRPYVWIMVRIGAIVLNVSDTASLDKLRKEGS